MSGTIFIDRRDDGKYRVVREGQALPSALSDTQRAAVALAREMRPTAIFIKAATSGAAWRALRI